MTQARRGREDPARHGAQAQGGATQTTSGARRRPLRRRHRRRERRRCRRRATAAARASSGSAGGVALLGLTLMRRRGDRGRAPGPGLRGRAGRGLVGPVLPARPAAAVLDARARCRRGAARAASPTRCAGALGRGNPLVCSALVAAGADRRCSTASASCGRRWPGFGFGVAGALLFAAVSGTVDVRYVPDVLDPIWLAAHAGVAALFATAVIRKA